MSELAPKLSHLQLDRFARGARFARARAPLVLHVCACICCVLPVGTDFGIDFEASCKSFSLQLESILKLAVIFFHNGFTIFVGINFGSILTVWGGRFWTLLVSILELFGGSWSKFKHVCASL